MSTFQVDGLLPREVVQPKNAAELATSLSELNAHGNAVIPWGGGTRMGIGNALKRYDVALDLTSINSNIEHVAGDMIVVCDAGVKIIDLTSLLAQSNQRLPFEVPRPNKATIGGSVASNTPSRLAPRFGGIRDWIIGMSVILADGTSTKSGGRVVKNVQGYDLHRLHTGAFGTLGVIVSVALKLVPLAQRTQTIAMWFDGISAAANAALEVGKSNLAIEAARLFSGPRAVGAIRELATNRHMDIETVLDESRYLMLIQVSGSNAALNRQINELTGLAGTVPASGYEVLSSASEADIWTYASTTGDNAELSLRIAAKPMVAIDIACRLDRALRDIRKTPTSLIIDIGYGSMEFNIENISANDALVFINEAKSIVRNANGSLLVERCPLAVKRDIDIFGIDTSSAQIMKNMKHQFDPNGILNPGRFAFKI